MLNTLSISSQLRWGILLLVMLCLLASGSLLLYLSYQQQLQQASRLQQAQATAAARHIGLYAIDLTSKLKYLAQVDGLMDLPSSTQQALLGALQQNNDAYDTIVLFDSQGKPLLLLGQFDEQLAAPLVTDTHLGQLLSQPPQNNSLLTPVTIDSESGYLISYFAVVVRDQFNKIQGLLVVRLNLVFLNFLVSQLNVGHEGYVYLIDKAGILVAHKDWNSGYHHTQLYDLTTRGYLTQLKQAAPGELIQYQGLADKEVVGAIAEVPLIGWQVIAELPKREIQLELYSLFFSMLLSLIVAMIFSILFSLRFIHNLISPLKTLTQAATSISAGNLNIRVKIKAEHEIGLLARTFNQMVSQLQSLFQQLQENLDKANSANRAKSTFLANMSHELRTPLNGVLGYAQVLLRDKNLNKEQRNGVEVILQSGRYLLTLISDILDLSRIEAGRFHLIEQDFNLSELLNSVIELFQARAMEKGLAFNYEPLTQLPVAVRGDDRRLRQVLSNLLGNAVKFTHQGGITLQVSAQNYHLQCHVIDTGIGITAHDIETIFNPFQQVSDINNKSAGTGLGLSICCSLIEMMGGDLTVESELGGGSRFSFSVRLAAASEPLKTSTVCEHAVITGFVGLAKTILVIDDHWENRMIVRDLLTPLGFNIIEADDGQKALIIAEQKPPDCVITDLVMPVMDGFELIRHLRKHPLLSQVPIIAASASVIEAPDSHSGCDSFIHKPFHTDELLALLQEHLQLEWQYDQGQSRTQVAPTLANATQQETSSSSAETVNLTAEEADQLYESAMMGDISGILEQVEALEQRDQQLYQFAQRIRSLAQAFDEEGICRLVEHYRSATQTGDSA